MKEYKIGNWIKIVSCGAGVGIEDKGLIAQLVDKTTVDCIYDFYESPFAVKCRDGRYKAMSTRMYIKAKPHEIPIEFRNILQTIEI